MSHMGHLLGVNPSMSKSHADELSNVFRAIFADARDAFPTLGTELSKDFSTLQALVLQRGIHVYLEDLPAVGKHLDRCLNNGKYQPSGLPLTKRYTGGVVIPKFLRGLYLLVFHESGSLKDDYSIEAVFFLRQICYLAKKAVIDCSKERIENEVLEFYRTDCSLPELDEFWGKPDASQDDVWRIYHGYDRDPACIARMRSVPRVDDPSLEKVDSSLSNLDKVSRFIVATLGSYDPSEWRFRHGPGAISETTTAACKFQTSQTSWSASLDSEFPFADYGFHNYSSWGYWLLTGRGSSLQTTRDPIQTRIRFRERIDDRRGLECEARMVAVPKSFTKPRLIAAEPSAHQFCQQNIWHYFWSRSRVSWIASFVRFHDQTLNQQLCKRGSKDNTLATVDLSAASDRVTCSNVGQFFRSNPKLLLALKATRTHVVGQELTRKVPASIRLRKFSTMGNACTFPVESLIFLGVALAAVLTARGLRVTPRNIRRLTGEVAVFGDDIVIPSDSREQFLRLLEVLHFKVNDAKTFWTGRFRESCGVDSFQGVEVTPAYWKGSYSGNVETLAMAVETSNNFYKKFLLHTSSHIASTLPRQIAQVATRSGVFGLQTRTYPQNSGLTTRMNYGLCRVEYLAVQTLSQSERTQTGGNSALLQYFTEDPPPYTKWRNGYNQRPRLRKKMRWVSHTDILAQECEVERELVRLRMKASGALVSADN